MASDLLPQRPAQVRQFSGALGARHARLVRPTYSRRLVQDIASHWLGGECRVWVSPGKVEIGVDQKPGRKVLSTGDTLEGALEGLGLALGKFRQPEPAPDVVSAEEGVTP